MKIEKIPHCYNQLYQTILGSSFEKMKEKEERIVRKGGEKGKKNKKMIIMMAN